MAYPPYDPSTADATFKYGPHSLCNLYLYYNNTPTNATDLNIWVEAHGGNDWQPGFDSVSQSGAGTTIPDKLRTASTKWLFAQVDYPTGACRANAGSILPFALFPDDLDFIAAIPMWIKDNFGDGSSLAGGRKINKSRIVVSGTSAGARKFLTMALQPVGTFAHLNGLSSLTQSTWQYRNHHKVRGVNSFIGQLDLSLFNANLSSDLSYHQVLTRAGFRSWDNTPTRIKWAASPYAHMKRRIPDNNNTGIFFNYQAGTSGLTTADFNPGPTATQITNFTDPHDPFGVETAYQECVNAGNGLCERHWGSAAQNPSNPYVSGGTLQDRIVIWTRDTLQLPF